ncbi:MAG: N-acetyl-gamma-glutamyl-phosphate reductase [Parvularculales bacterium]
MSVSSLQVAILGASGYTGGDAIRLLACHPNVTLMALIAQRHAGEAVEDVWPHLGATDLPDMVTPEQVDWEHVDAVVCGLPHGTFQAMSTDLPDHVKIIDMSADFRLRDKEVYAHWYGQPHAAPDMQEQAVYGLTEFYRNDIAVARLVACPGCYPTAVLLALLPLVSERCITPEDLIIDAKSGVSGAGRGLKQQNLFSEIAEAMHPYNVGSHRSVSEIEQELSRAGGVPVMVNFTPHLVPLNRGELVTVYARLGQGQTADDARRILSTRYEAEPFVNVLEAGHTPATRQVRGSNLCQIGVFADRLPERVIIVAAIDNLVKGSSGQAVQNLNLMFGFDETTGLEQKPLFP